MVLYRRAIHRDRESLEWLATTRTAQRHEWTPPTWGHMKEGSKHGPEGPRLQVHPPSAPAPRRTCKKGTHVLLRSAKPCLRAPYLALWSSAVGLAQGRCFHSNSAPWALESCERRGSNCSWRVHTGLASHVALAQESALCEGIWFELTLGLRSKQEAGRMLLDRSALPTSPPIGPSSVPIVQLFS
jgi:hypothetical protein